MRFFPIALHNANGDRLNARLNQLFRCGFLVRQIAQLLHGSGSNGHTGSQSRWRGEWLARVQIGRLPCLHGSIPLTLLALKEERVTRSFPRDRAGERAHCGYTHNLSEGGQGTVCPPVKGKKTPSKGNDGIASIKAPEKKKKMGTIRLRNSRVQSSSAEKNEEPPCRKDTKMTGPISHAKSETEKK